MIGWLADPRSWGPLTRAVAVLHVLDGTVLSAQRGPREWAPLDAEGIAYETVGCCGDESPEAKLAELDADLLVADPAWWPVAEADGRPCIKLGWASSGDPDWDLDQLPLHPWAFGLHRTRGMVRAEWGVDPDELVVAVQSPTHIRYFVEQLVQPHVPAEARMVPLTGWGAAHRMVGADLIVTSAGWAQSVECRWSGVPHVLLDLDGLDGKPRVTHQTHELADVVRTAEPAELPDDWVGTPDALPLLAFIGMASGGRLRALG